MSRPRPRRALRPSAAVRVARVAVPLALVGLAIATDWFDGRVARATDTVSEWGKVLDAVADKLAAAAITVALLVRPEPPNLPLWFVALAVTRDVVLAVGGVIQTRRLGRFTSSLWSGKVAVFALALTVVVALLGERAAVPRAEAARVGVPTLVLDGGSSFPFMQGTADLLAQLIPNAQRRTLEGQTHEVEASALAPVLTAFFAEEKV